MLINLFLNGKNISLIKSLYSLFLHVLILRCSIPIVYQGAKDNEHGRFADDTKEIKLVTFQSRHKLWTICFLLMLSCTVVWGVI
jgi:hypothetical protein